MILESKATDPTFRSPISVMATFSEPVTGFEAADVAVTNGTVTGFDGAGVTYTIAVGGRSGDGDGPGGHGPGRGRQREPRRRPPLIYDGTNLFPVLTSERRTRRGPRLYPSP